MATSLLRQLENLGEDAKDIVADTGLRRKLYEATQKLSLALETPGDTIQRIAYTVRELLVMRCRPHADMVLASTTYGGEDCRRFELVRDPYQSQQRDQR